MLMCRFKRLWISSVLIILALPMQVAPTVAPTPNSLSQALQQNVPQCAQSCLRTSLDERFPVACSGQENLQCLCSRYSNAGESLGEVALGCIYLSCPMDDAQASLSSTYGICLGQKDAVMPTKSVLTYVVTSATHTTSPSLSPSLPTVTNTPMITSTLQTQRSSSQSAFVDTISPLPSATSSATSTPVAATTAVEAPLRMTPAQIAGLSVAAVAAFVMAIGLMALSVCLRRRKERRVVFDGDEKGQGQRGKQLSTRFSHYIQVEHAIEPPKQFPMAPPRALRRGSKQGSARPAQRLGVGTSNSSSNSSLPLDQIGLAISAELDGKPVVPQKAPKANAAQQKVAIAAQSHTNAPLRPVSTMTQETVFEEDEIPSRRRSSMLLPTPPVPIPPIRTLQPSRPVPNFAANDLPTGRRSELFLDIPVRHERPQPKRIVAGGITPNASPLPPSAKPATRPRLAPPFQMTSTATSYESKATTASSRDASTSGDIIDYYFSSNQSRDQTPKASPARIVRPRESPKTVQIKSKKSHSSTLSRTASPASTNVRDSLTSQTSFETTNANDSTPEDEDEDKQLSDDSASNKQQLSPVAESPISKLRYPKVPRASNQLVPRSPKKSPQQHNFRSPRRAPDASTLLQKRNNALPPLLLESRPRLESPHRDAFTSPPRITSPPRRARSHMRSNSTESWSTTPGSKTGMDRKSRVQSGSWGRSPVMYEQDVVRPLNVRRKRDEMSELNIGRDVDVDFDRDGLKSPVWVPRLTPRRKGEDLFLEVGWGDGVRR